MRGAGLSYGVAVDCKPTLAAEGWLLVAFFVCTIPLVAGCWLLVAGCWLLVAGRCALEVKAISRWPAPD
ncbi:hypothetical protein EBL84_03250 [Marichromatium sp. AB31]|nr:hypothetical protein EBL84_03250 [Marichromatium sp. AB31]